MSYRTKDVIDLDSVRAIAVSACDGDESVEVIDYHLEPFSKNMVGFLSTHQKLVIELTSNNNTGLTKLCLFVKSMPKDSQSHQASYIKEINVFNQEAEFFNSAMPHLLEAVSVADVESWAPRCYLANENVTVLEDIRTRGYAMLGTNHIQGEVLESSARTMAHLHAASILAEKRLGKPLDELFPGACIEHVFTPRIWTHASKLYESLIVDIAEKYGGRSIERSLVSQVMDRAYRYVNGAKGKDRVICHGDSWPNNIMVNRQEQPPKCILVDYQMVKYAPRMYDVAQLIHLSTLHETKKKEESRTIEAYWDELCETLRRCDPDVERPTLEQLTAEYERARLAAQLNSVVYFPIVMLSAANDSTEIIFRKFIFRVNNDCVLELMEENEAYRDRIVNTVMEFVASCDKAKE